MENPHLIGHRLASDLYLHAAFVPEAITLETRTFYTSSYYGETTGIEVHIVGILGNCSYVNCVRYQIFIELSNLFKQQSHK